MTDDFYVYVLLMIFVLVFSPHALLMALFMWHGRRRWTLTKHSESWRKLT